MLTWIVLSLRVYGLLFSSFFVISTVTRKYDTLINFWVVGESGAICRSSADYRRKQESADYSSKQNCGKGKAVSLQPSLLEQADIGMKKPHSLLAMYASAVKQTCDHDWGRTLEKVDTWKFFKLRKQSSCRLVVEGWRHMSSCRFFMEEWRHIIWDMEETQIPKSRRAENPERKEKKTSPMNEFKLRDMVSLVKQIPKEKTCPRGKRQ